MKEIKTKGIILHRLEYSDTQNILKVYTESFGIRSFIITTGKAKSTRTKANILQPLNQVEIIASENPKSELLRIKELRISRSYLDIPFNISKSLIVLFLNEIIYKCLHEPETDPDTYAFVSESLGLLDEMKGSVQVYPLVFLARFAGFLGYYISGEYSMTTPIFDLREGQFVQRLPDHAEHIGGEAAREFSIINKTPIQGPYPEIRNSKLILQQMVLFYMIHNAQIKEVKSLKVLRDLSQ